LCYAYFAQTGGKNNDLVYLAHLFQKVVYAWTFYDIDVVPVELDFDGHDIVGLLYRLAYVNNISEGTENAGRKDLKAAVDQGLVKIEHETLAADVLRRNWGQQRFWDAIL
jgi:hypothetical protein